MRTRLTAAVVATAAVAATAAGPTDASCCRPAATQQTNQRDSDDDRHDVGAHDARHRGDATLPRNLPRDPELDTGCRCHRTGDGDEDEDRELTASGRSEQPSAANTPPIAPVIRATAVPPAESVSARRSPESSVFAGGARDHARSCSGNTSPSKKPRPHAKCIAGNAIPKLTAGPRPRRISSAVRPTTSVPYAARIQRRLGLSAASTSAGAASCRSRIDDGWRRSGHRPGAPVPVELPGERRGSCHGASTTNGSRARTRRRRAAHADGELGVLVDCRRPRRSHRRPGVGGAVRAEVHRVDPAGLAAAVEPRGTGADGERIAAAMPR